jgi:hypothetical protein
LAGDWLRKVFRPVKKQHRRHDAASAYKRGP